MAQLTMFTRDQSYTDADLSNLFQAIFSTGVYDDFQGLQVIVPGDGSNGMSVFVCAGRAWIKGHYFYSDTTVILPIDAADGVLNRKDIVVLEYTPNNAIAIKVIKGTAALQPTAPAITQSDECYQLKLAEISVSAGITKVTSTMITDYRYDDTVCGIVTGVPKSLSISQFMTQANAEFTEWFNAMKNQLSTDAAGNLQKQIDNCWKISGGTSIAVNTDIHSYLTPGNYYCNESATALTLMNCPAKRAFTMRVYSSVGVGNGYIVQEIQEFDTGIKYWTKYDSYANSWSTTIQYALKSDIDASIAAAKAEVTAPPVWATMDLTGNTAGATAGTPCRYTKLKDGKVRVEMHFTYNARGTVFTLPEGYRPANSLSVLCVTSGQARVIYIGSDGKITTADATATTTGTDEVRLQTEYYTN